MCDLPIDQSKQEEKGFEIVKVNERHLSLPKSHEEPGGKTQQN